MRNEKTKELLEKKADSYASAQTIMQTAENEGRDLTDDEKSQFDAYLKECDDLQDQVDRIQKLSQHEQSKEEKAEEAGMSLDEAETKNERYQKAYRNWMRVGIENVSEEDRKLLQENFVSDAEGRQMTTTDGSGGELIPTELADEIFKAMKFIGGVRQAARVIRTDGGHQIDFPTSDDTGNKGELVSENTSFSTQKITTSSKKLEAYKYSSKIVKVPVELLQDADFDVESFVREDIIERLTRITEQHYTTGDGSSKPQGVVGASTEATRTSGTSSFSFSDILALKHAVDPLYRSSPRFGFMMHDDTLRDVKQQSVGSSDARPLWQPSFVEGEPDTIDGTQYWINNEMATQGTGNKFMLAGDFGRFMIRDVNDMRMRRLVERYAEKDQVGFVAIMRTDSELIDAGGNPIQHLRNATS